MDFVLAHGDPRLLLRHLSRGPRLLWNIGTMTPENPSKVVVSSKGSSDGFICKRDSLSLHPSSLLFADLSINPIIKPAANLCTKTQNNRPAKLSRAAARPAFGEEGSAGR